MDFYYNKRIADCEESLKDTGSPHGGQGPGYSKLISKMRQSKGLVKRTKKKQVKPGKLPAIGPKHTAVCELFRKEKTEIVRQKEEQVLRRRERRRRRGSDTEKRGGAAELKHKRDAELERRVRAYKKAENTTRRWPAHGVCELFRKEQTEIARQIESEAQQREEQALRRIERRRQRRGADMKQRGDRDNFHQRERWEKSFDGVSSAAEWRERERERRVAQGRNKERQPRTNIPDDGGYAKINYR
jgi:hypothetical protein